MKREAVQAELARELGRLQQSLEEDLAAVGNLRAVEALSLIHISEPTRPY